MSRVRQICTFILNNQLFGLDVDCVLEVIHSHPITPVPLAPESTRGLINLRGQVITTVDLRRHLELESKASLPDESQTAGMNMIVRSKDGPLCFSIDDVGDVLEIDQDTLEPTPDSMHGIARKMIESVCKLPDRLLLILKNEFSLF